jgi:NitT/TauT family transport system permease protein
MKKYLPPILFFFIILLVWEFSVFLFKIPNYLLPRPTDIFYSLIESFPILVPHISITLLESFWGFIIGSLFGFLLAIAFTYSSTLEKSMYPYAIALKSVPIVAIAPLLIVWFGNGILPKIIVSAIISFFPVVVNSVKGLNHVDVEALNLFQSLAATKFQVFYKLRLLNSLPFLFSALKMSSTLSVIGAIVGEFSGADKGLGYFILISSHRLETTNMFLGIILASIIGIVFFYIVGIFEFLLAPWGRHNSINE